MAGCTQRYAAGRPRASEFAATGRAQTPLVDCLAVARRFTQLPPVPDHPRLEEAILELWEREGHVRAAARGQSRRAALQLHRRPRHGEQGHGRPHRLGPHAEGRLPALQGAAGLRPALPERLGLPGPVDRGRRREGARAELQARDRGVRPRAVRGGVPQGRRVVVGRAHARVQAPGPVDGLGQRLLHVLRHEHRVHLALLAGRPREGLAVSRPPLVGVVPALRDVAVAARADAGRRLPGA